MQSILQFVAGTSSVKGGGADATVVEIARESPIELLQQAFHKADVDGNGKLSQEECNNLLQTELKSDEDFTGALQRKLDEQKVADGKDASDGLDWKDFEMVFNQVSRDRVPWSSVTSHCVLRSRLVIKFVRLSD